MEEDRNMIKRRNQRRRKMDTISNADNSALYLPSTWHAALDLNLIFQIFVQLSQPYALLETKYRLYFNFWYIYFI